MAAVIPAQILGLRGQCVKQVAWDKDQNALVFHCDRDRRFKPVDHRTGAHGTVNRRLRRCVQDLPLWGRAVVRSIAYCQIKLGSTDRRMERLSFVEPGHGFTRRFARFVSQLARHMSIAAVARYTGLAWRTVKAMDERALERDLPALDPGALTGLRYLGVDEVARAKGHDDLTLVYDLDSGALVWVTEGRRKAGLVAFFLFEVINNRGVQLQHHEILKARLLSLLAADERAAYALMWDACADMNHYIEHTFASATKKPAHEVCRLFENNTLHDGKQIADLLHDQEDSTHRERATMPLVAAGAGAGRGGNPKRASALGGQLQRPIGLTFAAVTDVEASRKAGAFDVPPREYE